MAKAVDGDGTQHPAVGCRYGSVGTVCGMRVAKRDVPIRGVIGQRDITTGLDIDACVHIRLEVQHLCRTSIYGERIERLVRLQISIDTSHIGYMVSMYLRGRVVVSNLIGKTLPHLI